MTKEQIIDECPIKNFAMIAHILLKIGLSSYEIAAYVAWKSISGENSTCFMCNKKVAKLAGMGETTYKKVKKRLSTHRFPQLGNKPLIHVKIREKPNGSEDTSLITLLNIWPYNENILLDSNKDYGGRVATEGGSRDDHKQKELNKKKSSKQQQHCPPDSLLSLRSVSESESPQELSDMDAPTKKLTKTIDLPKPVVAAASNKRKRNSPKNEEDLTNHSIASLLDDVYGSMLQSGEGPPPPVVPAAPVRAPHDAAFEKRFVVPSAVGMTIKKKEDVAVAPDGDADDKKILLDQLKDCLTKENLKVAEEYIDCFYEEVFSANNPPGVVIHAIKNDYAKGKIADAKQWKKHGLKTSKQQLTGDKDAQAAANRPYAKAMYDRLKPKRIHRLFDIELGVNCIIVTYWRNGRLMSHNIGFLEDNFEWKIDQLEKSCWNYIGWIKKDYGHKLKDFHTYEYLEQEIPI